MDSRVVRDRAEEAVRDLALTELSLSVGAAVTVFSELVPLLQWSSLRCDRAPNQVRFLFRSWARTSTTILSSDRRIVVLLAIRQWYTSSVSRSDSLVNRQRRRRDLEETGTNNEDQLQTVQLFCWFSTA